jgi:7-cyano-7-deazaguanine synthase
LLSGGLDSTTVAAYAQNDGYELEAITYFYGQKHNKELESANKVAEVMGINQEVIDISFFRKLAWYSALTESEEFNIPKQREVEEMAVSVPITYVPLRNTLFITLAAAYLESEVLNLIEREKVDLAEVEASIFIAANAIDYSGYPDCRPEYFEKVTRVLFNGSKLGTQYRKQINIQIPLISYSKADIIKLAMQLGAPLEYTWSCYEGREMPCGTCDSCMLRARGFTDAGYEDPLIVRLKRDSNIAKSK